MSCLDVAVRIVNTCWPRPLAKSRTSRNPGVLVLEKVSLETSISKLRALCQRATRCTSTWRYCIRIFQSTRRENCKFQKHDLQHFFAFCEFRFRHLRNQKTNICKSGITPFANLKNIMVEIRFFKFFEITLNQNEVTVCNISKKLTHQVP